MVIWLSFCYRSVCRCHITLWHRATLQYRHNEHDGISNHRSLGCLLNRLFRCTSKKTSKLRVTGPCITNVFATRRKNFSQWHRSFQRKLLSHWLKLLRHVAIMLVIQGPGFPAQRASNVENVSIWWRMKVRYDFFEVYMIINDLILLLPETL